jgi:hypothetical protein
MEKISWIVRVRNEGLLQTAKEERNILYTVNRRKANWIGNILRRNCLLEQVIEGQIEGRIEVTGRRGRRGKQLPDGLKEKRGYLKLKEDVLGRTVWGSDRGRCCGPVVKQTVE